MNERIRVLVVDDERDARTLLGRGLERHGYEVVAATDGEEAVAVFDNSFAAVVTDLVMPRLDGVGLLARIHDLNPDAVRVVITSFADKERTIAALNGGAHYLVEKPFTAHQMIEVLGRLLTEKERCSGIEHLLETRFRGFVISDQERMLIVLVLKGLSNREISDILNATEQAIKNRLYLLYRKLGVASRGEIFHRIFPI